MPSSNIIPTKVADFYDGIHDLDGVMLDEDSYQKHCVSSENPTEASAPIEESSPAPAAADPFEAPQDLRQMASQAFDADRQAEYRPETASFAVPVPGESYTEEIQEITYVGTEEIFRPDEMKVIIGAPTQTVIRRGSSYMLQHSSGSLRTSSGSYRLSSGSFRVSSYSLTRTTTSWHTSFRTSSGSFRSSYGSYRPGSGSPCEAKDMPLPPVQEDKPYLGSLSWSTDAGGYGLDLI